MLDLTKYGLTHCCLNFIKPNYTIGTIMYVRSLTVSLIFSNKIDTKLKHIFLFQKNPTWRPGRSAYGVRIASWKPSIENVHCTPRIAPRLRPDCARCFWCVIARGNVTSTDPFFSLGKVVKGALDNISKFSFWLNFIYHVKIDG